MPKAPRPSRRLGRNSDGEPDEDIEGIFGMFAGEETEETVEAGLAEGALDEILGLIDDFNPGQMQTLSNITAHAFNYFSGGNERSEDWQNFAEHVRQMMNALVRTVQTYKIDRDEWNNIAMAGAQDIDAYFAVSETVNAIYDAALGGAEAAQEAIGKNRWARAMDLLDVSDALESDRERYRSRYGRRTGSNPEERARLRRSGRAGAVEAETSEARAARWAKRAWEAYKKIKWIPGVPG